MKLCAWLRIRPEVFFRASPERAESTVEAVVHHLHSDPALNEVDAGRIASVVREMYAALARQLTPGPAVACHLRAATIMRAGVAPRLGSILTDMHTRLEELIAQGDL